MELVNIIKTLRGRWGWIFPMINNNGNVQSDMERSIGAVKCFIRKCCEERCLY